MRHRCSRGFSLVEVLVSMGLIAAAFAGLGHLAVLAARANESAHATTAAVLAARQKLEELRGAAAGLSASPPGTLDANVAGHWDALGLDGTPVPVGNARLIRRWAVASAGPNVRGPLVLRVRIIQWRPRGSDVTIATMVSR